MRIVPALLLALATAFAGETRLGKPLVLHAATSIEELTMRPERYAGKTVQVKGSAREVCRAMGCWMELSDPATGKAVRIKVEEGAIVFPREAVGKTVIAEGKFVKLELTREQAIAQARHEAEENGRKFDSGSITSARTIYQVQGTGAVILE